MRSPDDSPTPSQAEYLTRAQLAALLQMHPKTLEAQARAGKGPKLLKVGRRVLYRRADVDAWLASCERGGQ